MISAAAAAAAAAAAEAAAAASTTTTTKWWYSYLWYRGVTGGWAGWAIAHPVFGSQIRPCGISRELEFLQYLSCLVLGQMALVKSD